MAVDIKIPSPGESIVEVVVGDWLKPDGAEVRQDEPVVVIETDKVNLEVPAPVAGVLRHGKAKGEPARVGDVVGRVEEGAVGAKTPDAAPPEPAKPRVMPSAERAMATTGVAPEAVTATGPGGRVLKEDVMRAAEAKPPPPPPPAQPTEPPKPSGRRVEEVMAMTPIRKRIAERLVQAQQAAALLTTFNEIDCSGMQALRRAHQAAFTERYGIKLGLMSFFVKAAIDALKAFPAVNAEVRGTDIVYHHYYDIGVAVGGGRGLVVPVIRNAELLSFAEVELAIADLGNRAKANKITLEELQGGTFSISNGGIYGSMLSTPIVNPPQSGILGLHAIQDRAVVVDGAIVVRPMMYVALTYDHRIVDGREAVSFLKRLKDCVEAPARMLLEI